MSTKTVLIVIAVAAVLVTGFITKPWDCSPGRNTTGDSLRVEIPIPAINVDSLLEARLGLERARFDSMKVKNKDLVSGLARVTALYVAAMERNQEHPEDLPLVPEASIDTTVGPQGDRVRVTYQFPPVNAFSQISITPGPTRLLTAYIPLYDCLPGVSTTSPDWLPIATSAASTALFTIGAINNDKPLMYTGAGGLLFTFSYSILN